MIDFALAIGHGQKRARFDMDFWILKFGTVGFFCYPSQIPVQISKVLT